MGDMADLAREREFDNWLNEHFNCEKFNSLLEEKSWETRDKRILVISEMETSHIENSMRMIEKSGYKWRYDWYKIFKDELLKRGVK